MTCPSYPNSNNQLYISGLHREEAVGIGQPDSVAKYGIGESVGRSNIVEDDYGISVKAERLVSLCFSVLCLRF
jgi:hypothetical protein